MTRSHHPYEPSAIMLRQTAAQMVATYEAALQKMEAAYQSLAEAQTMLENAFGTETSGLDTISRYENWNHERPDEYLKDIKRHVKRGAWRRIVEITEIHKLMSEKRSDQFNKALDDDALPELTIEAIYDQIQAFAQNADALRAESVKEVYDFLRPKSSYVTNSPFSVGKQVIITNIVEHTYGGGFHVTYYSKGQNLIQLDRLFHTLDGKGAPNGYVSELSDAINTSGKDGYAETEYFKAKCYHNGNLHITFKRLDLVALLNQIAGGEAVLRDPSRKTRKGVR